MTENIKTKPQNDEIPVEDFKKSDDSLGGLLHEPRY